jgi:DNA-directed RNA polymerase specialized sigma24 family protein
MKGPGRGRAVPIDRATPGLRLEPSAASSLPAAVPFLESRSHRCWDSGRFAAPHSFLSSRFVVHVKRVRSVASKEWVASADDWLASPYLDRLVTRVAAHHSVPASELPDLIQETRIALWRAGLDLPVSAAFVAGIARNKAVDLVRRLARRRAESISAGRLCATTEVDAELHHLLSLRVSALPRRLRDFYELRYAQGLSEREIARVWRLCRASVRWLDQRCRERLCGVRKRAANRVRIPRSRPVNSSSH